MVFKLFKLIAFSNFILFVWISLLNASIIKKIEIIGNERISKNTIIMFSDVELNKKLNQNEINLILKRLYDTNYFENISIQIDNNNLKIIVKENPIIEQIIFKGIKADKIKKAISENLILKSRSSYNEFLLKKDIDEIQNSLKQLGYYFSKVEVFIEK